MPIIQRTYAGRRDQPAMLALAKAFPGDNLHVADLPYRFSSWALDDPANCALWEAESGQLLGWAVLQAPFWTLDYAFDPAQGSGLHRQILDWGERRARQCLNTPYGRPTWFVNVFADQHARRRDLESAGYVSQADRGEDSWSKVFMERAIGARLPASPLHTGFKLRPLAGAAEVEAYVDLHRAAFETRNMTVAWRERTLAHPAYNPDLDLVAVAPDGRLAAFCIAWLNRIGGQPPDGQIEPLGSHLDFRHLGLGRALLAEALRRLEALGALRAVVETDSYRGAAFNLYKSMDFHVAREVVVYGKEYR